MRLLIYFFAMKNAAINILALILTHTCASIATGENLRA
jgi:hypothetical protein